jgi:hypothetical protein
MKKTALGCITLSVALFGYTTIASLPTSYAAVAAPQPVQVAGSVKPVWLNQTSYYNVVDVNLIPTSEGKRLTYTLSLYNGSSQSLDLSDYWYRLTSSTGESYSIKLTAADAAKKTVAPKTKTFIKLYSDVGDATKLSDLNLKIIKFDFTKAGYESLIGQFKFSTGFSSEVPIGSYKKVYEGNSVINAKIYQTTINTGEETNQVNLVFSLNNIGKQLVTLPKYKYKIVSADGFVYDATPDVTELKLQPLMRQEVNVTASIPKTVKTSGLKLYVIEDGGDAGSDLPAGVYHIPNSSIGDVVASDNFKYTNSQGTFQFKVASITRQPYESGDILSTKITITNNGKVQLPIPELTGYYYFDNQVKNNLSIVTPTNTSSIQPGETITLTAYSKVASNFKFTNVKAVLSEKQDQNTVKAGELQTSSYLSTIPKVSLNKTYTITRDGYKTNVEVNRVAVYQGVTTKTYTAQLSLENLESRTLTPLKLTGYFINENNEIYPATITLPEGLLTPSSQALVRFSADFPSSTSTVNLRLIVGEAVNDQSFVVGNGTSNAYVSAVSLELPMDENIATSMQNLNILPYQLSITKMTPLFTNEGVILRMHYKMTKDTNVSLFPTDRKLMAAIEYFDENNQEWQTMVQQDIGLESSSGTSFTVGERDLELKQATEETALNLNLQYRFRIYEGLGNNKKAIAEQGFTWYIENTLK